MNLKDKVCVVTGAAKGIGLAIAQELINQGAIVALSDLDSSTLQEVSTLIASDRALCYKADVRKEEDIRTLADSVRKDCGPISVWVNNAGLARHKPVTEFQEADVDLMMDVNLKGTILGSKYALLHMTEQQKGHIVNVISTAALRGIPGQSVYCATKFAVRGFTEALQEEAASLGIRVTAIYPGGVDTGFWDAAQPNKPPVQLFLSPSHIAKGVVSVLEMDDFCTARELVLRSIHDVDTLPPSVPPKEVAP